MRNSSIDLRASRNDRRIGTLKYGVYLFLEPINHIFNYCGDGKVYELDRNYFINEVVNERIKKEKSIKGGLEQVA